MQRIGEPDPIAQRDQLSLSAKDLVLYVYR